MALEISNEFKWFTQMARASVALVLLTLSASAFAVPKQKCSDRMVASLREAISLGEGSSVRATACKRWPSNEKYLLMALVVEPQNYPGSTDYQLPLYIAMMNADSGVVISKYQGSIGEDAVTQIADDALTFDTAPYLLTPGTRAFGLRVSGYVEPHFSEGGADDFLSLFVMDRQEIRPVLNRLSMVFWRNRTNKSGDSGKIVTSLFLAMAPTASNGYADLVISAKTSNTTRVRVHTLRYDGHSYPFDLIDLWIELGGTK